MQIWEYASDMTPISDLARAPERIAAAPTVASRVVTAALAIGVLALTVVAALSGAAG